MKGVAGGDANAEKFRRYLEALRTNGTGLPARGGGANLSLIAQTCGFDRGVFYQNKEVKLLLEEAASTIGFESKPPRPGNAPNPRKLTLAQSGERERSSNLEAEVVRLRAELAQMRSELARFEPIRRLMAETGRMP